MFSRLSFGYASSCHFLKDSLLAYAPFEYSLQFQSGLLSLLEHFHRGVKLAYTSPDSLNQDGLLTPLSDPVHYLAPEFAPAEGSLESNDDSFVLLGEIHDSVLPPLPNDVRENAPLDCVAGLSPLLNCLLR